MSSFAHRIALPTHFGWKCCFFRLRSNLFKFPIQNDLKFPQKKKMPPLVQLILLAHKIIVQKCCWYQMKEQKSIFIYITKFFQLNSVVMQKYCVKIVFFGFFLVARPVAASREDFTAPNLPASGPLTKYDSV